jgi:predicted TIM-barrel fold metal-dependent hydrolase
MYMIDADSHVIECEETWSYLDPAYHAQRPIPVTLPTDTEFLGWNAFWLIDRQVRHFGATPPTGKIALGKSFGLGIQQLTDIPARLKAMDRMRVEKQIVHPSFCLSTMTENRELEAALMKSFNSFMARQCGLSGERIFYNAVVPFRSPDVAVEEIRRIKPLGGAVSILARGIEYDRPLDHPDHYPIYEEAERQGMAVAVHLGPGCPAIQSMFDGHSRPKNETKTFFPPRSRRLVSTLLVQYGLYNLFESSLIDDFPNLRWGFFEGGGAEWVVGALSAIHRNGRPDCTRYFQEGRVFVGAEPDEDLGWVTSKLGQECLVVSSDMPHFDEAAHDNVIEEIEERDDLDLEFVEKLLRTNAARLFNFDGADVSSALAAAK